MKDDVLLFGTMWDQPSLLTRLKDELAEAVHDFRRDPKAYITAVLNGGLPGVVRSRTLFRFGIAVSIVMYAITFAAILVFWTLANRISNGTAKTPTEHGSSTIFWAGLPKQVNGPNDKEHAGGGGGGGNHTSETSAGLPPTPSLATQVIAPFPEPQLTKPALPMPEIIPVDPRLNIRPDDSAPTGLPDGVVGPPMAGPGSDHGLGGGKKGGVGDGDGRGLGPGKDWNTGNNDPAVGSLNGRYQQERLDTKPIAQNRPRPNYTEEARRNKIQGVIRARALIGIDGSVQRVVILSGLPDGLNEEAIRAVYQMRFKPATRSGQAMPAWVVLEVEFNLR